MPKDTLDTRDLVSDARQSRYLQELSDHIEDSGDPASVGNSSELAETFNVYARPRRNRKIVAMIAIGTVAFLFTQFQALPHTTYDANAGTFQNLQHTLSNIGSSIFMVPWLIILAPLYLLFHRTGVPTFFLRMPFMQSLLSAGLNTLLPIFTGILWCGIAGFFLFPPRFLRRKLYEILKRNTKRRT
jgi:hypothetical protein